jgi:hypothetical protein
MTTMIIFLLPGISPMPTDLNCFPLHSAQGRSHQIQDALCAASWWVNLSEQGWVNSAERYSVPTPAEMLAVEDLATLYLDAVARERGFTR